MITQMAYPPKSILFGRRARKRRGSAARHTERGLRPSLRRTRENMDDWAECLDGRPAGDTGERWSGHTAVAVLVLLAGTARARGIAGDTAPSRRIARIQRRRALTRANGRDGFRRVAAFDC